MLIECGHCGAPLDVEEGQRIAKCSYCAKSNRVGSTRTLQAVTPAAWAPPPTWIDPRTEQVLRARAATASGTGMGLGGCITATIVVATLFAVGIGVLVPILGATGRSPGDLLGPSWDGTHTLECGGNERLRVEGVSASLPNEVAVRASGNCRVELSDCTIASGNIVIASGNSSVVLRDCTLTASGNGAEVGSNARVEFRGSTLDAAEIGVVVDSNATAVVAGGRVSGVRGAVSNESQNATVQTTMGAQMIDGAPGR